MRSDRSVRRGKKRRAHIPRAVSAREEGDAGRGASTLHGKWGGVNFTRQVRGGQLHTVSEEEGGRTAA